MHSILKRKSRMNPQAGFSIVEVLIAGMVLVIGVMGLMVLIITAVATNNRNKTDSSAMMLASTVLEQINSTLVDKSNIDPLCLGASCVTDCSGTRWPISASIGGPPVVDTLQGPAIQFSDITALDNACVADGASCYHIDFVVGGGGGLASGLCNGPMQTTYDVRWNIQSLTGTSTYLVTISAKPRGTQGGRSFAFPSTLRTFVATCRNWGDCT